MNNAMELRSTLLREVSNIIEDDTLVEKAVDCLRNLRQSHSCAAVKPYTVNELQKRVQEGLAQEKAGLGINGTELFDKIEKKRPWLRK